MAKVREILWPEEFKDLKRIEEFMICGICYEYIDTSVMTPCSHNYCSVCIRKYLHYKTQCPACFHDFFEKDLYINRAMDGLIHHYLQVREKILNIIENRNVYNSVKQLEEDSPSTPVRPPPVRPARSSQLPKSPKTVIEIKQTTPKVPIFSSPLASTSKSSVSSPTACKSPKVLPSIAKMFNTPKRKEPVFAPPPAANAKTVSCPVCRVNISEQHINVHLDACLKREVGHGAVQKKQVKRPPLPKLVLHVMKESELRKKMKEFGLSALGDRKTMINRFTRYSVIYNAECDKANPRPVTELIRQCEMEEKQERKMDSFLVAKSSDNRLQIEKHAKEEKIEEAQKNYRVANKSSFDQLIEEVRNRRKMEKKKGKTEQQQDKQQQDEQQQQDEETASTSSKPSTSTDVKSVADSISESDEIPSYIPSAEIAFQDSDSDEACPLQHYRSDNAVKSLCVNLDDSSSTSVSGSPTKRPQKAKTRNSSQLKKSLIPETDTNNPYEMSTDNSTDDEIPSSPVLKKKQNRKRVKLSNKALNTSLVLPVSEKEQGNREVTARDLCNSIIKDFSFDGQSDDSSSEFADKRPVKKTEKVKDPKIDNSLEEVNNTLNQSKLHEEFHSGTDKQVLIENVNSAALTNGVNNSVLNNKEDNSIWISAEMFGEDDFGEFVNRSIIDSTKVQAQKPNDSLPLLPLQNHVEPEKENNAASANENTQPAASESSVSRPVRKRNPPVRFIDKQPARKPTTREKTPEAGCNQKSNGSESGSLKRRRGGRPKASSVEPPLDDVQNPPKRPVRRRQTVSEQNSS